MPRFDWTNDDARAEFIGILSAFQSNLEEFDLPPLDNDEMAFRFYCATGGLVGYIAKILRQVVSNAIFADVSIISMEDLKTAYEEAVYADESKQRDMPKAFDPGFTTMVSAELLERVKQIGVPAPEELRRRGKKVPESDTDDLPADPKPKGKRRKARTITNDVI
jgi:hypothetical protein